MNLSPVPGSKGLYRTSQDSHSDPDVFFSTPDAFSGSGSSPADSYSICRLPCTSRL